MFFFSNLVGGSSCNSSHATQRAKPNPCQLESTIDSDSPDVNILSYEQDKPTPVPQTISSNNDAYEKLRKGACPNTAFDSDDGDLVWTSANNSDPRSGTQDDETILRRSRSSNSVCSEGSNTSGNRFIADISQLSPPTVQFVIGTPPGCGSSLMSSNRRRSAPIVATNLPSSCLNSPIMRQLTPPRLHNMSCPTNDSPTSIRLPAICSPDHFADHHPVLTRCDSSPMKFPFNDSSPLNEKSSRSNQFSFGHNSTGKPFLFTTDYRSDKMLVNPSSTLNYTNQSTHRCCCSANATSHFPHRSSYETSPLFLEGSPKTFLAPELPEETLLSKDHNETLARLNFVLTLVECIMKLAEHRGNALNLLAESTEKEVCIHSFTR